PLALPSSSPSDHDNPLHPSNMSSPIRLVSAFEKPQSLSLQRFKREDSCRLCPEEELALILPRPLPLLQASVALPQRALNNQRDWQSCTDPRKARERSLPQTSKRSAARVCVTREEAENQAEQMVGVAC
ncbi:hypothetical protein DNTS_033706, partial [Danionella cerebrum]